ncbi:MAG: hypothetical protein N3H31_00065 [Candidatus Nezhaarchaeota archaeon]|nr:hypothetical protein [Candidatus Nezhaarchaeota archaeon]
MERVTAQELTELLKKVPKESFELLVRNLRIRDYLGSLYEKHSSGLAISYDKAFEELFGNFLSPLLRPLEAAIYGVRQLAIMLNSFLDPELVGAQSEIARAYVGLIKSWLEHLKITMNIFLGEVAPSPISGVVEGFLKSYREKVSEYMLTATRYLVSGSFFLLPKEFFTNLEKAVKRWEEFLKAFENYRGLLRGAYVKAAEVFIEKANVSKFSNYQEFAEAFLNLEAQAFDEVLASPSYVEAQKLLVESLMDYVRCCRELFEEALTSNPASPFATISLLDEAFRRITDLKRRVREVERRLALLEEGLRSDRGEGKERQARGL